MRAWLVGLVLPFVLVGFPMLLSSLVIGLVPIAHQLYAAIKVNQGAD